MSLVVVLSCEHASCAVPPAWQPVFEGAEPVLRSHRGWDPGALELARDFAAALGVALHAFPTTRLLVEPNRSLGHPRLFSEFSRKLPRAQRDHLVDNLWRPHRERVEQTVAAAIGGGAVVLHLGVHSFTPVLGGRTRNIDVAVLDDPKRPLERSWTNTFLNSLASRAPTLRLARNRPYRGWADGLTTTLRQLFPAPRYVGIELEVNQAFPLGDEAGWARLRAALVAAVVTTNATLWPAPSVATTR